MRFPPLRQATFVRRDNRFRVTAALGNRLVAAHLADPGRLSEILVPNATLWLAEASGPARKTSYDVYLAEVDNTLVCIHTQVPNRVFEEALQQGWLMGNEYPNVKREVKRGQSRLDFRLTGPLGCLWVEVKSVSLVCGGRALFPDAPTTRGARHVRELTELAGSGEGAAIVFVVQRGDATCVAPHEETDPEFAAALRRASAQGVQTLALRCHVSTNNIRVTSEIPVVL